MLYCYGMIKVSINNGRPRSPLIEASVWNAKFLPDGTLGLYTGLDEDHKIILQRGFTIKFDPFDEEDSETTIKVYGAGDMKNICEEVNTRMAWKMYTEDAQHTVSFRQMVQICTPAINAHVMELNQSKEYIFSKGHNTLSEKLHHNAEIETGLIRNVKIGKRKAVLVGGYGGLPVKFLTTYAAHEFARIVNENYPE